jgi:hypothetical protein
LHKVLLFALISAVFLVVIGFPAASRVVAGFIRTILALPMIGISCRLRPSALASLWRLACLQARRLRPSGSDSLTRDPSSIRQSGGPRVAGVNHSVEYRCP